MQPQCLIQLAHERRRHPAYLVADSLDRDRADLFCLSLRILLQAGVNGDVNATADYRGHAGFLLGDLDPAG
jgi:hypothetical protein